LIKRVAAKIELKGPDVIKGIQMEGLRRVGSVEAVIEKIASEGVDELLILDAVASLFGQSAIYEAIKFATRRLFLPVTAGGGVRSIEDAHRFIDAGADRISVNSATFSNPKLLEELAGVFGAQAVVVSVEAKRIGSLDWKCFYESGREDSGIALEAKLDAIDPDVAGELLLTSVDRDGLKKGPDFDLVQRATEISKVPIIYSGGIDSIASSVKLMHYPGVASLALSSAIHSKLFSVSDLRIEAQRQGVEVRSP
jgi:imidazoleglycerol phosphate synthase cyclase subunit